MKLSKIALDPERERDGVSSEYLSTGIILWTKRAWSPAFVEAYRDELKRLSIDIADIDDEEERKAALEEAQARAQFYAFTEISFDHWENVEGAIVEGQYDGSSDEPLEYTPEIGRLILDQRRTPAFEPLYTFWKAQAERFSNFQAKQEAESLGKSPDSSDGS